ncbi:MAG: glycoside hydrolase family 15 protein [bacterium]
MPRAIPIGNGSILMAFDKDYQLREFCFPHVGEENHMKGRPCRFGVWMDGAFNWVPDGWRVASDYLADTLATHVTLVSERLRIRITANDIVDFHENIHVRRLRVENLSSRDADIRLFLAQDFRISGNKIGDTAAFRPENNCLVHYKGERYFLANIYANKKYGIEHFATGNKEVPGQEGTWRDAEDGVLSGNLIAQGAVDSVTGIYLRIEAGGEETCYYWICAGRNWGEVCQLDELVRKKKPEGILKRTMDYWRLWVDKENLDFSLLPAKIARLYRRSLLIARTQIDNNGGIIAANDSDVIYFNRDTYSYMWPRDASLAAYAFDLAGYPEIGVRFFNFCARIIEKEGYLQHKFTPTGMPGSSWHPWSRDRRRQLPIQEDETALVLWALWNHYRIYRDIEFIKPLYKPLIKSAADFLMNYRDTDTRLPLPSYDLWEERHGVLTFTASTVYGGLAAAANFTRLFGEIALASEYQTGAEELKAAMVKHLYLPEKKRFCRMLGYGGDDRLEIDDTVDASLYGIFAFGVFPPDDERVRETMRQVEERLWCRTPVGGLARYENDAYYRVSQEVPGNPWFVTTLWLAQYRIAASRTREDLAGALELLEWVADRALPSGVLAEQVNPLDNSPLSVSPLTWSHATFVAAVQEYLNKLLEIEKCPACGHSRISKTLPSATG